MAALSDGRARKPARGARPKGARAASWPVLAGGILAIGLWRWGDRLPRVPEGDVVVAGEAAMRGIAAWGEALERAEGWLRGWPVASLSLLTLGIVLGAAMLAWG